MISKPAALYLVLVLGLAAYAGDLQKANEYLQQALTAPDNASRIELLRKSLQEQSSFAAHYHLGKALRDGGQPGEAIQEFRRAMELTSPADKMDRAHALFQVGATMAQQGNGAEALTYMQYSLGLEKHPAVEQAILRLETLLSGSVQSAAQLERAFVASSRDLVLGDRAGANYGAGKIPVWIQFEFDRADLARQGKAQADELGRALASQNLGEYRFRLIGHTDLIGTAEYNRTLSQRRAEAVAAYISAQFHFAPERLMAEGHGMNEPLVSKGSRDEQAINRRVEVIVVPSGK
jgi:outer membrane protein OmpA-like peptidoglycan-associated protein